MFGDRDAKRQKIAASYLFGNGLEIGALHYPLDVPGGAKVRYVDRMTVEHLRAQYPELNDKPLVKPDYIDQGEGLSPIADASQDFVISSHVIEHMEDPIRALKAYLRVLKPGGAVFLAVPDRRNSFDVKRPVTPFEHLVVDHETGPHVSRAGHFVEWSHFVDGLDLQAAFHAAQQAEANNYSIHFHVWEPMDFLEMLNRIKERYGLRFEVELSVLADAELTCILRKG